MSDPIATIQTVTADADAELAAVSSANDLEQYRIKYLGSKGRMKELMKLLASVPPTEKRTLGQKLNAENQRITAAFEEKKSQLGASVATIPEIDVTEPGLRREIGHLHILMQVIDELTELFSRMGFAVAAGPELEDDFHNFVALNIPESHPARDPLDNFYIEPPSRLAVGSQMDDGGHSSPQLLRTQTSTVQIRVMETQKPPIRVVIPGRVYRPDTVDQTHLFMFHQLEALVVDKDVTMVDLKSTILQFVRAYFGPETKVRFRPSFFPFTEPSAEVDVWFEDKQRWIELGGCGMVHPNVFGACGVDSEIYSGWAFGFGIERIAMRKYGIDDIRHFIENDLRFLRQF